MHAIRDKKNSGETTPRNHPARPRVNWMWVSRVGDVAAIVATIQTLLTLRR